MQMWIIAKHVNKSGSFLSFSYFTSHIYRDTGVQEVLLVQGLTPKDPGLSAVCLKWYDGADSGAVRDLVDVIVMVVVSSSHLTALWAFLGSYPAQGFLSTALKNFWYLNAIRTFWKCLKLVGVLEFRTWLSQSQSSTQLFFILETPSHHWQLPAHLTLMLDGAVPMECWRGWQK